MDDQHRCGLSLCTCKTEAGNPYCSAYCEQAATIGIEKDFCQCAHADCKTHQMTALDHPVELPESIHLAPGQVTIECRSMEHLRDQLMLLTEAIDVNHEALRAAVETTPRRRPASEVLHRGARPDPLDVSLPFLPLIFPPQACTNSIQILSGILNFSEQSAAEGRCRERRFAWFRSAL